MNSTKTDLGPPLACTSGWALWAFGELSPRLGLWQIEKVTAVPWSPKMQGQASENKPVPEPMQT